jgi:hypothetical protein
MESIKVLTIELPESEYDQLEAYLEQRKSKRQEILIFTPCLHFERAR